MEPGNTPPDASRHSGLSRRAAVRAAGVGGAAVVAGLAMSQQPAAAVGVADSFNTIAALKAADPATLTNNQIVHVAGFDTAGDGCGGFFAWYSGSAANTLDGIEFNGLSGHWRRIFEGPIHTRWVGIRPSTNPGTFDADGFGTNNKSRWNDLDAYCANQIYTVITSKAHVVAQAIFVDPGIHDFADGTLTVSNGVNVQGAGGLVSVLRTDQTTGSSDVFVEVGTTASESAGAEVAGLGILHFSTPTTAQSGENIDNGIGIVFHRTLRQSSLRRCWIQGFNDNVRLTRVWGFEIEDCTVTKAHRRNIDIDGAATGSLNIEGNRIDDNYSTSHGRLIYINIDGTDGAGRNIRIVRNEIQRSQRQALMIVDGVASVEVRANQFEGNNKESSVSSHPDIWLAGTKLRNAVVDGNYFTTKSRTSTKCRAINVRSDVEAAARLQVTNNSAGSNNNPEEGKPQKFEYFVDIDANVAMNLVEFNNIRGPAVDSIPSNVVHNTIP